MPGLRRPNLTREQWLQLPHGVLIGLASAFLLVMSLGLCTPASL